MDHCFLTYQDAKVHALRFGKGPKLLIALHGFADEATMFSLLRESLESKYTVYCLDLPFHGKTQWAKKEYDQADISAIFSIILKQEKKERFDLMGFSLGGRIVQKMLFDWQGRVDKIYLIAPYGLGFNASWVPQGVKTLLHRLAQRPEALLKLAAFLHRCKLLKRFHYRFAQHHLADAMKQERLFYTWRSLHYFKLQPKEVKALFKNNSMEVALYFGAKDRVIPVEQGRQLSEGLANVQLHVLDAGHRLVGKELGRLLMEERQG